jgi:hypothetical protein
VTITARDGAGNTATQACEVDVTGGSTAYTHDANGNLTSDGVQTYQWNARNELIRVQAGGVDVAMWRRGVQRLRRRLVPCRELVAAAMEDASDHNSLFGTVVDHVALHRERADLWSQRRTKSPHTGLRCQPSEGLDARVDQSIRGLVAGIGRRVLPRLPQVLLGESRQPVRHQRFLDRAARASVLMRSASLRSVTSP